MPAFTDFDPEIPRVNHQYYVGDGMILVQYNDKQSPLTTNQKHGFKTGLKMISNPLPIRDSNFSERSTIIYVSKLMKILWIWLWIVLLTQNIWHCYIICNLFPLTLIAQIKIVKLLKHIQILTSIYIFFFLRKKLWIIYSWLIFVRILQKKM